MTRLQPSAVLLAVLLLDTLFSQLHGPLNATRSPCVACTHAPSTGWQCQVELGKASRAQGAGSFRTLRVEEERLTPAGKIL